jgi:hypothetical protein
VVHEHLSHLKIDSRLLRRKQWASDPTVQQEIDALPDVAEKAESISIESAAPVAKAEPPVSN